MIKIYDGEVFSFDIKEYNRSQILKQCWENSKCSELKFLVYDGNELIGAMTYYDILADKTEISHCQIFGEDLFDRARKYFKESENRQSCIPVQSREGELMFLLVFVENRLFDIYREGELFHEYWDLNFESDVEKLDFTLLERAQGFYFYTLEEYTYEIARLIQKIYPHKKICFRDKLAKEFFPGGIRGGGIKIYESTWEFKERENPVGYMYVNSGRDQIHYCSIVPYMSGHYGSIQIMESLLWCRKRKRLGNRNEGQTVLIMESNTGSSGLVDILKCACAWVIIAKSRGWLPVMKLDCFPNQYLEEAGENMWEYFFCSVSDLSVEEAMQSADVISAQENDLELGETVGNPYMRELYAMLLEEAQCNPGKIFNQIIRRNKALEDFLEENLLPEIKEGNRILGVVARGTDYTQEMLDKASGYKEVDIMKSIQQVIRRSRECASTWDCNYIFVATEDEGYFQLFSKEFGERLLFVEQQRVQMDVNDDVLYISDKLGLKKGERKLFAMKYLLVIYCLSKCNVLISNKAICGADFLARMWNEGKYEYTEII